MGAVAIRYLRFLRSLLFLFLFSPLFPLFLSRGKVPASRKLENFCNLLGGLRERANGERRGPNGKKWQAIPRQGRVNVH